SADVGAEPVLVVTGQGSRRGAKELVNGVQVAVAEVFVNLEVQRVGSGLDDGVELAAGGVAVFGAELVGEQGELGDIIVGYVDHRTGDGLAVVVDAIYREVVAGGALSADGRTGAVAGTAAGGDT